MKTRTKIRRCAALLLTLSVLLSLAACGGSPADSGDGNGTTAAVNGTTATSMHLMRTEGTVAVSDSGGDELPLLENMALYSGYGVRTREESYSWINLDDVKLIKMDEQSRVAIQKEDKALEIEVKSGKLFFNVTEPLADDETMNIRISTMMIGVRGTCGWVEHWGSFSRVYLVEGKVECSAGEASVQISAGEMAQMTEDGQITVDTFTTRDIPEFVWEEIGYDEELTAGVPQYSRFRAQYRYVAGDELPSETKELLRQVLDAAMANDWEQASELTISTVDMENLAGGSIEWEDTGSMRYIDFYSEFDGYRVGVHSVDLGPAEIDGKGDGIFMEKYATIEIRPESGTGYYIDCIYGITEYEQPDHSVRAAVGQCENYNWTGDFEVNMIIEGTDIPTIRESDIEDEYNKWND